MLTTKSSDEEKPLIRSRSFYSKNAFVYVPFEGRKPACCSFWYKNPAEFYQGLDISKWISMVLVFGLQMLASLNEDVDQYIETPKGMLSLVPGYYISGLLGLFLGPKIKKQFEKCFSNSKGKIAELSDDEYYRLITLHRFEKSLAESVPQNDIVQISEQKADFLDNKLKNNAKFNFVMHAGMLLSLIAYVSVVLTDKDPQKNYFVANFDSLIFLLMLGLEMGWNIVKVLKEICCTANFEHETPSITV